MTQIGLCRDVLSLVLCLDGINISLEEKRILGAIETVASSSFVRHGQTCACESLLVGEGLHRCAHRTGMPCVYSVDFVGRE